MTAVPVIAIFDIGKTNKKFFLIDEAYSIVLERSISFEEIKDEDGDACENLAVLTHWILETLTEILQVEKFAIRAINFSAYGASFVYIDKKGKPIAPLYSYLKIYPDKLKDELYNKYGGAIQISCETASPVLGSLNSGMQLYRLMVEKPELYSRIKYALHLPQYLSYIITQKPCSDITSIGCHTQLWDFQKKKYHTWVISEGIEKKLAPLLPSDQIFEIILNNKRIQAGIGLHDSCSALIPYLTVFAEPFVLISTGTWCISLNPFNKSPLTNDELKKDCLCYMGYNGNPVKASRLFAGNEHEQQVKRLAHHFKKREDYFKKVKYNATLVSGFQKLVDAERLSKQNETTSSVLLNFEIKDLTAFNSYEEAYHYLMMDIARQQVDSTQLVIQHSDVKRIFVDGGFSNNSVYMHLLALSFPHMEVYAASVAQATAIGAALAIHMQWNSFPPPAAMVKLKYYKVADILKMML